MLIIRKFMGFLSILVNFKVFMKYFFVFSEVFLWKNFLVMVKVYRNP